MPRKQYTTHYIYKTTNIITGKFYVGMHSAFNLDDGYLGSGKRLWYSIKKYGKENHKKEILEFCKDRNELIKREEEIVNEDFIRNEMCMNLMKGGKGGYHKNSWGGKQGNSRGGKKGGKTYIAKENRKKGPIKIKEMIKNGTFVNRRFGGKKHTDETKKRIGMKNSENHLGEKNSQYGTCWIKKNNIEIKIKKNYLNEYLLNGYILGRIKHE